MHAIMKIPKNEPRTYHLSRILQNSTKLIQQVLQSQFCLLLHPPGILQSLKNETVPVNVQQTEGFVRDG